MPPTIAQLKPFILASGSPRRRQLLEEAGATFTVHASGAPEPDPTLFSDAQAYVTYTAWLKAEAVAGSRRMEGDPLILAADTMAAHAGHILGKPADRDDADRILSLLCGTVHECWTGVCLRLGATDCSVVFAVVTKVHMRPLSDLEKATYLASGDWEGKAGAYGIQDKDDPFVTAVDGSWTNVMGLPMERLNEVLQTLPGELFEI